MEVVQHATETNSICLVQLRAFALGRCSGRTSHFSGHHIIHIWVSKEVDQLLTKILRPFLKGIFSSVPFSVFSQLKFAEMVVRFSE